MSGIEIAGLVLGVLPLLTEAVQVARSLKERYKSSRFTSKEKSTIENNLDKIRNGLLGLQRQYGHLRVSMPPENASVLEGEFSEVANALREMLERFKPVLTGDKLSVLRDLKAILKNRKVSSFSDITKQLDQASEKLSRINQLLLSATTSQRVSETRDEIIDKLESLSKPSVNSPIAEDTYNPSFYVPANPLIAKECLDYDVVDEQENPATFEGKLKAKLLRLVKERQKKQSIVPILGAIGMRGTGKTCALRGLGEEQDVMDQFCDGVLFLSFSESSSEEDVKHALCSIVYHTGGRNLSKEMKELMGENAINDIIGRLASWFKNRKCLFLVDNLCDTPSTGSSLLVKLSAIIQSCDKASGLVYTTTNEIDPFDATVRFGLLSWDSEACSNTLMKAAGFSREQIIATDQEYALMTILNHCQGLKIALVIAGRNVRLISKRCREQKEKAWERYACALLESPRSLLTDKYGDYQSLYSQLSISLRSVSSLMTEYLHFQMPYTIEEAFQALCIADKEDGLRDSTLCRLWNLESVQQAREVSKLFADANLVESICKHSQGRYCEEIRVHGLVLDYASHLADQNYIGRSWIKGSEVWALRLVESYFGADESLVSNASTFTEWWNGFVVRRNYFDECDILSIITRLAASTRTQSGQILSDHCSDVMLLYVIRRQCLPIEAVPIISVGEPAIFAMRRIVSTMAQEREVVLSELTYRLLIFACCFVSKLDTLMHSAGGVMVASAPWFVHMEVFSEFGSNNMGKGTTGEYPICQEFVLPSDPWMYIKHLVEVCWTLYDNWIGAKGPNEEPGFFFAWTLDETTLTHNGIPCSSAFVVGPISYLLDKVDDVDLSDDRSLIWRDSCRRFAIDLHVKDVEAQDGDTKTILVEVESRRFDKDEEIGLSEKYDARSLMIRLYLQRSLCRFQQ